jgi:hypothetical protein
MAADGSSSSQQDSVLLNTQFCLNDINKGEESFDETSNSHVDISGICSSITAKNLESFLQTLHQVYKSPSNEKTILQLDSEAVVDENKSNLNLKMSFCKIFYVCLKIVLSGLKMKNIRKKKQYVLKTNSVRNGPAVLIITVLNSCGRK